jgi:hypothetical protein
LDAALREASEYLNTSAPEGSKLAILAIKSDYPPLSDYVIDMLTGIVVDERRFTVVDRANLALIEQEMQFQMSGEVSDQSAQSIGHKLGAQTIVSGSITAFGNPGSLQWRLSLRAMDVESAAVQGQFNRTIPNGATMATLTGGTPPPLAAPDRPFADGLLGGSWSGALSYIADGRSYRDGYAIRLYADGFCWVAVTAEDGAAQAAEGYWSAEDGNLRVDCEFRNPAIPRLRSVNWLSLYALQNNNHALRVIIRPAPDYPGVVAFTLYKDR